jgi:hypothetical protein
MGEHRITLSAPEVEALIKCLEALFDNEHLSPMARTLHNRIIPMIGIGSSGKAVSSTAEAAAERSHQKTVVRDRTAMAKKKGMGIVPRSRGWVTLGEGVANQVRKHLLESVAIPGAAQLRHCS